MGKCKNYYLILFNYYKKFSFGVLFFADKYLQTRITINFC